MSNLSVSNLTYRYGAKTALNGISFALPAGFCALLGPNGAGKSTLFSLLTGLFVAHEGQVAVAGHDMARHPRRALARLGVVFQQPTLDLDTSVIGNLRYFAALHGMRPRDAAPKIDAALTRLGMEERAHEKVRALNGGHRRRMEIARALIHDPAVLLLDEPTVGLDAASRAAITDHVHDLARDGLTVFWATHLVDEIYDEDHVVMLHRGKILTEGNARDIAGAETLKDRFLSFTGAET